MIHRYSSFAKLNLFLYVTGKLDTGYHTLYSLMTPISMHDDIEIEFTPERFEVFCSHPEVPEDDSNLVIKAARSFYQALEKKNLSARPGLSVSIKKRIPVGGGLGGGSSNAAVVLAALNEQYKRPFSTARLMDIGLALGADIPFFISGRPALARGVGEKIEPVPRLKPYHIVLCDPGVGASTADVYKNIDFRLTLGQKDNIKSGLNVLLRGRTFDVGKCLHNDLEESACRLYPRIGQVKKEMAGLLERPVDMTGSGSSLFALFTDPEDARKGFDKLSERWSHSSKRVFLSSFQSAC